MYASWKTFLLTNPASGTCGCVGMMGSGLGGGLGKHMGYFSLVLDNIIDMSVVIADGSLINVSATSHPDLYWGMRGAGHNYGIVTQFNFKTYDQPAVNWFRVSYTFTGDKLESFFEALNNLNANGTQPKEVGEVYTLIIMNEKVSTTEASGTHPYPFPNFCHTPRLTFPNLARHLLQPLLRRLRSRRPPLPRPVPRPTPRPQRQLLPPLHRHARPRRHRRRWPRLRRRLQPTPLPRRSPRLQYPHQPRHLQPLPVNGKPQPPVQRLLRPV